MALVRLFKDLVKDKEFGHRLVPIIPDEARTFGLDSIFPSAKIFNTNGQNYMAVDRELMLSYKESEAGQIMHTGINEAGSAVRVPGGGHVVRDARRAADPVLLLLLDVRVPAHRRPVLGGRRPDGARVPHRRHGGPHDADRRGPAARRRPLAAAGGHHAARRALRPGLRVRDPAHRARRHPADVRGARRPRPGRHLLPDGLQRADGAAGRARGRRRRGHPQGHPPHRPAEGDGPRAQILASGVAVPWALEAQHLLARGLGRARRGLVGDELERAASRRARRRAARVPQPGRRGAHPVPDAQARRVPRARSSPRRTTTTSWPTRCAPGSRAATPRSVPTASGSPTPARRLVGTSRSTVRRRWCGCCSSSRDRGGRPEAPAQAIERYRLHDVTAGTSGNTGGDS